MIVVQDFSRINENQLISRQIKLFPTSNILIFAHEFYFYIFLIFFDLFSDIRN